MLVLCGIPGSGKSSLAKVLAATAATKGIETSIIEFDEHEAMSNRPTLLESPASQGFDPEIWKVKKV